MEFERNGRSAVVWRKIPKETRVVTLFQKTSVKIKQCKCCRKFLPVTDFYMESKSKAKFPDSVRHICINCYDACNGRYLTDEQGPSRKKKENNSFSLEDFF